MYTSKDKILAKQATYIWHNTVTCSRNHCCRENAVSIAYSECVSVSLVIRHQKRMRPVTLSPVACLGLPCFF